MTLKSHTFNSGNQLVLDDTTSFVGFHGLTVYTVSYMEQDDNGNFEPCNKDVYMSEAVAIAGYEERLISDYPFHVLKKGIGISDIIIESFNKYLDGGGPILQKNPQLGIHSLHKH